MLRFVHCNMGVTWLARWWRTTNSVGTGTIRRRRSTALYCTSTRSLTPSRARRTRRRLCRAPLDSWRTSPCCLRITTTRKLVRALLATRSRQQQHAAPTRRTRAFLRCSNTCLASTSALRCAFFYPGRSLDAFLACPSAVLFSNMSNSCQRCPSPSKQACTHILAV